MEKELYCCVFSLDKCWITVTESRYFHDSDKLVIAHLSCTIWPIFSLFLIFCCYFTRLKAREISQQNMKLGKYWSYCIRNRAITNAYRHEMKNYAKSIKKDYLFKMFKFLLTFLIDILPPLFHLLRLLVTPCVNNM